MSDKYAVCIGNNYPGTTAELGGCVNDANDWAELLAREGYDTTVLMEATKEAALDALIDTVVSATFGDRIVFTYSGHGTWLPDNHGDEADGRDEALVMSDYMRGGLITDDELQDIFGQTRRGVGTLILSDSCHSGTVSRLVARTWSDSSAKTRFLSPAEFSHLSHEQVRAREALPASTPRPTASLISGCGDLEYSYDASFNGRGNGAFTKVALDSYASGITLNNWFKAIRARLPHQNYPQTPQLTTASAYRKYLRAL